MLVPIFLLSIPVLLMSFLPLNVELFQFFDLLMFLSVMLLTLLLIAVLLELYLPLIEPSDSVKISCYSALLHPFNIPESMIVGESGLDFSHGGVFKDLVLKRDRVEN